MDINRITLPLLEKYPPNHRLGLVFGELVIGVASNSMALIEDLAAYYEGFAAPRGSTALVEVLALETPAFEPPLTLRPQRPDPGKTRIKEEYADIEGGRVVRKRLTGMVFFFGPGLNLAVGPALANSNQVVNFINNRLIQHELDQGALLAHAAGVASGGCGLLIAGFSGRGKSTLALHLMSRGLNFVSNDRLLLHAGDGQAVMVGVPKLPRINPGTALNNPHLAAVIPKDEREAFARLGADEIWDLEHKYDVRIQECFGPARFRLKTGLCGVAVLNWERDGGGLLCREVRLEERRDLLAALIKSPGLFYLNGAGGPATPEDYLKRLAGTPAYELAGGVDFLEAARRLACALGG